MSFWFVLRGYQALGKLNIWKGSEFDPLPLSSSTKILSLTTIFKMKRTTCKKLCMVWASNPGRRGLDRAAGYNACRIVRFGNRPDFFFDSHVRSALACRVLRSCPQFVFCLFCRPLASWLTEWVGGWVSSYLATVNKSFRSFLKIWPNLNQVLRRLYIHVHNFIPGRMRLIMPPAIKHAVS